MNRPRPTALLAAAAAALAFAACSNTPPGSTRQFPLTGEVVAIKADRSQVKVKHEEIPGFMPAMTMDFNVKAAGELNGIAVGDRLAATLVLTDEESHLTAIRKTGTVPLAGRSAPPPDPVPLLKAGDAPPDVALIRDDGRPLRLTDYRGSYLLFTFIYTRCPLPDYCPRMHAHFAALQRAVASTPPLPGRVRLLSISFDPAFDTPARLADTARALGASPAVWRFATGPIGDVERLGAVFGLNVVREGPGGGNITHNLRTVLLDPDGKLVKTYGGNDWTPDGVVKDLLDAVR
jgi:protein SCO1